MVSGRSPGKFLPAVPYYTILIPILQNAPQGTYTFHTVHGRPVQRHYMPKTTSIVFTPHKEGIPVPVPDPRLLKFHRACCLILNMSGAGEYVEKLLRDMEDLVCKGGLAADGSSDFAAFCILRGVSEEAWRMVDQGVLAC